VENSWSDVDTNDMEYVAALSRLTRLSLCGIDKFDNHSALKLSTLTNLQRCGLYNTQVSSGIVDIIATQFPNMKHLSFRSTHRLSPDGYEDLGKLTSLSRISLQNSQVGDPGLLQLQALTNLTRISLLKTNVSSIGLKYLTVLPNLLVLSVSSKLGGLVFPDEVGALVSLTKLVAEQLSYEEGGAKALAELTNLVELRTSGSGLDGAVPRLIRLTKLRMLALGPETLLESPISLVEELRCLTYLSCTVPPSELSPLKQFASENRHTLSLSVNAPGANSDL
jgi:hypothetical protein